MTSQTLRYTGVAVFQTFSCVHLYFYSGQVRAWNTCSAAGREEQSKEGRDGEKRGGTDPYSPAMETGQRA